VFPSGAVEELRDGGVAGGPEEGDDEGRPGRHLHRLSLQRHPGTRMFSLSGTEGEEMKPSPPSPFLRLITTPIHPPIPSPSISDESLW